MQETRREPSRLLVDGRKAPLRYPLLASPLFRGGVSGDDGLKNRPKWGKSCWRSIWPLNLFPPENSQDSRTTLPSLNRTWDRKWLVPLRDHYSSPCLCGRTIIAPGSAVPCADYTPNFCRGAQLCGTNFVGVSRRHLPRTFVTVALSLMVQQ